MLFWKIFLWHDLTAPFQEFELMIESLAGLTRNQPVAWTAYDPFTTPNETEVDHIWEMTDIDSGVVALGDIYAAMKNLPKSQRFPWDDSKGIYLLNVHHNLHCLV